MYISRLRRMSMSGMLAMALSISSLLTGCMTSAPNEPPRNSAHTSVKAQDSATVPQASFPAEEQATFQSAAEDPIMKDMKAGDAPTTLTTIQSDVVQIEEMSTQFSAMKTEPFASVNTTTVETTIESMVETDNPIDKPWEALSAQPERQNTQAKIENIKKLPTQLKDDIVSKGKQTKASDQAATKPIAVVQKPAVERKQTAVKPLIIEKKPAINRPVVIKKESQHKIAPASTPAKTITFDSLEQLPLQIDSQWSLDLEKSEGAIIGCHLKGKVAEMQDGQGGTPVEVTINQKALLIKTKSNIDLSYENDGIIIDRHPRIDLDATQGERSAVIKQQLQTVLEQLKQARQLHIHLGFWPTWPKTQTYQAVLDLQNVGDAKALLEQCSDQVALLK